MNTYSTDYSVNIALTDADTNEIYAIAITDNPNEVTRIVNKVKENDSWSVDDIMIALVESKWVIDIVVIDDCIMI